MTPTPPGTFVRDETALYALWTALMGEDGFGRRSVWLIFLDGDDRTLPVILPVDDIAAEPDPRFVGNLASIIDGIVGEGGAASVAMLLSRPGPAAMQPGDRRWAAALSAALRPQLRRWPIHLATADRMHVFAPDDLIVLAS